MLVPAPSLPPGLPQLKAPSTAEVTGPQISDARSADTVVVEKQGPKLSADDVGTRVASETASKMARNDTITSTLALIQRILAPEKQVEIDVQAKQTTIEELLPPLTSSNEVDLELYAILAIVIKDFVNPWYSKITTDHMFTEEIIQVFAHCSRSLEQRLRHVDRAVLLLDELLLLLEQHVKAYRAAESASAAAPRSISIRRVYHELLPNPALPIPVESDDSLQVINDAEHCECAYRQLLVQGALAVLLPTEDLQNGPLRTLVNDVVADLIIGQAIANKVCQAWFLHDAITKVVAAINSTMRPKVDGTELHDDAKSRLEKFGLLSSQHKSNDLYSPNFNQSRVATWFWRFLHYAYIAFLLMRSVWTEFQSIRTHPEMHRRLLPSSPRVGTTLQAELHGPNQEGSNLQPVLSFSIFSLTSTFLKMAERMPWMEGIINFWQHILLNGPGHIMQYDSLIDRLISRTIEDKFLTPALLPSVIRTLRTAIFPNNTMGPPAPPPPSPDEAREIRRGAAEAIASLLPSAVAQRYYATSNNADIIEQIERDMVAPFDDVYLNKHLVYAMIELILIRLIPELAEETITELLADRGVDPGEVLLIRSDSPEMLSDDAY